MEYEKITIKKKIRKYADQNNIPLLGFVKARHFFDNEDRYLYAIEKDYLSNFVKRDTEYNYQIKEQYNTIIPVLIPYPNPLFYKIPENHFFDSQKKYGKISSSSWGLDYHDIVTKLLMNLAQYINDQIRPITYKIMVDNVPFSERAIAAKAGLGWIGKHSNLINKDLGSFVFIGELLINLDLAEESEEAEDLCEDCRLCVEACPVQAIDEEYRVVNTRVCLSQQTQEKEKNDPLVIEKIKESAYLYGCDICQMVCPFNQQQREFNKNFLPDPKEIYIPADELLSLSNKDFKKKYGHLAASWRGKKPLAQNAKILIT